MGDQSSGPRRVRVERNIYRGDTGVYEVGFRDGSGKQRWKKVEGGITAAKAVRDELLARRGRGERVEPKTRLRLADAAAAWLNGPVRDLRPRTDESYRNAVNTHLLPRFGDRRLDVLTADDLAALVRDMRAKGLWSRRSRLRSESPTGSTDTRYAGWDGQARTRFRSC
jgi:hypothetical protein